MATKSPGQRVLSTQVDQAPGLQFRVSNIEKRKIDTVSHPSKQKFLKISLQTKRNQAKELNDFKMNSYILSYLHAYFLFFFTYKNNEISNAERGSILV